MAQQNLTPGNAIPEGGYGWVCVLSCFLLNAHSWGINSAYGVILSFYLSNNTFPGTTALEYAFVGGLSISCALLASPLVTYFAQRFGINITICIGAVLQAISLITTSFTHENWQLFLSQGICFGLGMGFCYVGSVGVVSHWFEKRRSLANGITASGSGMGGLIYSLATGAMIPKLGFPWAMRILGILCIIVNVICGLLLRNPPGMVPRAQKAPIRFSHLLNPSYLLLMSWGIFSTLAYIVLLFSLSSYCVAVGLTQHQASIASALLNLGQGFGRPAIGILSDKFGRINVSCAATLAASIFCFAFWVFAKSMAVVCVFGIIVGLFAGTIWATAAPLMAEVVGLADIATGLGLFWMLLAPPTAVGEAIALQLRDDPGDKYPYLRVQMFAGAVYAAGALCLAMLKVQLSYKESHTEKQGQQDSDASG